MDTEHRHLQPVLVSGCLLGEAVRYNGADKRSGDAILQRWLAEGRVVSICPEVAGGLPVPRPPSEIENRAGAAAVLSGGARVLARTGTDVTDAFLRGAEEALARAERHGVRVAVLKEGSPSCGSGYTYDGTFSGTKVPGQGVTAARLAAAGVRVFSEAQFAEADRLLQELEQCADAHENPSHS
jgi:uncharacterized protein YbbK (DUF523 family)